MVEALLRLPTVDITPVVLQSSDEATIVAANLEALVGKAKYAARMRLEQPLAAIVSAVMQASQMDPDFHRALLAHAASFLELAKQVLTHHVDAVPAAVIDLLEMLSGAAEVVAFKEPCAAALMDTLVGIVERTDAPYQIPRLAASTLINLLSKSKNNKNRLAASCSSVGAAMAASSDYFFQMQCVEVLFRLHTHNKLILAQSSLPADIQRLVTALPNDATLLTRIQAAIDEYNADRALPTLISFEVLNVDCGSTPLCATTRVHFSPSMMVVMLPEQSGNNVTVPYDAVRSVKLSKDHKLGLRLSKIPPKLSQLMDAADEAKDTLRVTLTGATLAAIKTSPIHQWIAAAKRTPPAKHSRDAIVERDANAQQQPPPSASKKPRKEGQQPQQEQPEDDVIGQLKHAVHEKLTRRRQSDEEVLRDAALSVQQKLDAMRAANAKDRDGYEAAARRDMDAIHAAEVSLKEYVAQAVATLNAELAEVQHVGQVVKAQIDEVELEQLETSVGAVREAEGDGLLRMKARVDDDMRQMEQTLVSFISSANPLRFLTTYLSRKLDENSQSA